MPTRHSASPRFDLAIIVTAALLLLGAAMSTAHEAPARPTPFAVVSM